MNYEHYKNIFYRDLKTKLNNEKICEEDFIEIKKIFYSNLNFKYAEVKDKNYSDEILLKFFSEYTSSFAKKIKDVKFVTNKIIRKMEIIKKMKIIYNYIPYDFRDSYNYIIDSKNLFIKLLNDDKDYDILLKDLDKIINFFTNIKDNNQNNNNKSTDFNYEDSDIPITIVDAIKGVE